jgi:hypothetical protein
MQTSTTGAIETESFTARYERKNGMVFVRMTGTADMDVQERMQTFLDEVHQATTAARATEGVFEMSELCFMNSSCLSLLLRFITTVMELPPDRRYRVRFRPNANMRWQTKSFAALKSYGEDLVIVEATS